MSSENGNESRINPQKKRLEQLKAKKEKQEEEEQKQLAANSKSKKKASRELVAPLDTAETNVKMSAETVDYEYSVEEDFEDEEYKSTKNDMIKNLLIKEKKLRKAIRLSVENDKKLSAMLEEVPRKFDEYEKCLDSILEQITVYKEKSSVIYANILHQQLPSLQTRWQTAQQTMRTLTISFSGQIYTGPVFGNLVHYGIFILRKVLYTWAYCRDLIPKRVVPQPVVTVAPAAPKKPMMELDKTQPMESPPKKKEKKKDRSEDSSVNVTME